MTSVTIEWWVSLTTDTLPFIHDKKKKFPSVLASPLQLQMQGPETNHATTFTFSSNHLSVLQATNQHRAAGRKWEENWLSTLTTEWTVTNGPALTVSSLLLHKISLHFPPSPSLSFSYIRFSRCGMVLHLRNTSLFWVGDKRKKKYWYHIRAISFSFHPSPHNH